MIGYWPRRHQFDQALQDQLAQLEREGVDHLDKTRIEEIGQRFGLDAEEACEAFMDSQGDIWEGELVETGEGSGWKVGMLQKIPSSGGPRLST